MPLEFTVELKNTASDWSRRDKNLINHKLLQCILH